MARNDKEFLIRVKADIDQALKELKKLPTEVAATGKATGKAAKNIDGMGRSMQNLKRAAIAYFSIRTVINIVKQADAFNVLNVRIKTATKNTGDYVEVQRELFRITQQNGAEFATTVSLFQGLARTAPELQATNAEVLKLVNTVQQLGVISGASQAAQRAGLLQFSQGLASGVFRAEEFNSILENLPEIASRLATGMGLSVGELRKMVLDGKLLSKDVFDTLLKQSEDINAEFKDIPDSVERSATRLNTSFANMLTKLDQATGVTGFLADRMAVLSENFDNLAVTFGNDALAKLNLDLEEREKLLKGLLKTGGAGSSAEKVLRRVINGLKAEIKSLESLKASSKESSPNFIGPKQPQGATAQAFTTEEIAQQKQIIKQEEDRAKSLKKLNAEIAEQGRLYGKSAEQIALYKLEQAGATPADIAAAKATFATMRAQKQLQETTAAGATVYQETRTKMEQLANTLVRLNQLYEDGAFGAVGSTEALDTLARATSDAEEKFNDLGEEGESTFAGLTAATRGWGDEFTNTLADMVKNGKLDFSSLADSIISDLLRIMIYQQITAPLFSGLGFSGFAPVKHGGGVIGSSGGSSRSINPMVFAGAKRFHDGGFPGLRSDEVPIIAQKGERILSKKQVASGMGGGGVSKIELINRGSPSQVVDSTVVPDITGDVLRIVIDDIDRGGQVRSRIKSVSSE